MAVPFTPQTLPLTEIAWEPLIPLIGRANRSIAHYDGVLYGVPNPEVLLSPLTTQEAVLSSRIEGTQATLGEVLKFQAGEEPNQESKRSDIQEILNYRRALREAETELKTRPFIHPFSDGNGRLGRILIPLFLYEKKLLHRPMFYLSSWIEENRGTYVSLLRGLGEIENSWNRWIEFFLRGIDEQARRNAEKARSIMDLYERMKRKVIEITRSQFAVPLLDQMFERPLFQSTHLLFEGLNISRQSVASLLAELKKAEILSVIRQGAGRRPTVYVFPELLNLCEGRNVF